MFFLIFFSAALVFLKLLDFQDYLEFLDFIEFPGFCKDFSWFFGLPKKLDRKFRGEILKIERRNLEDFPPKFAVKLWSIFKLLIINDLQNLRKMPRFVKIFYQFLFM